MQGRRVEKPTSLFDESGIGEYWHKPGDGWYGISPNGLLCSLRGHVVTEHRDGTITASPSILVGNGTGGLQWHGYLKAGVWEEC